MALVVSTLRHYLADATSKIDDFGHAESVPGHFAAEGIFGTHAVLYVSSVKAAGGRMAFTTVAVAGTALISRSRALGVPFRLAAEGVNGTNTTLHQRIHAAGGSVCNAAASFTLAAIRRAIGAVLVLVTNLVPALGGAIAAIFRTGVAILAKERFAGVVAAAVAAVFRAGFAVFFIATGIVAAEPTFATVFRAELTAFEGVAFEVATNRALAAVFRTVETGFGFDAEAITTAPDATTVATAVFFDFGHADVIPGGLAAEGIQGTDADLDFPVNATRGIARLATTGHAFAAVFRATFARLSFIAHRITTALHFAYQVAVCHRLFDAEFIPCGLATVRIKLASAGLNCFVFTARAFLDGTAITTQTTVIRAGPAGFAVLTNVIAAVTTDVLAANALTFHAEAFAGAFVAIFAGYIGERSVHASSGFIAAIFGTRIAVVTASSRTEALAIDADIGIGTWVTIVARHAIQLGRYLAGTGCRIALARFALPKAR